MLISLQVQEFTFLKCDSGAVHILLRGCLAPQSLLCLPIH